MEILEQNLPGMHPKTPTRGIFNQHDGSPGRSQNAVRKSLTTVFAMYWLYSVNFLAHELLKQFSLDNIFGISWFISGFASLTVSKNLIICHIFVTGFPCIHVSTAVLCNVLIKSIQPESLRYS